MAGYVLQDSCNVLLQQYLVELMDSGQHSLMPVYACHLRADERREVSMILLPCRPDEVGLGFKSRVLPSLCTVSWTSLLHISSL